MTLGDWAALIGLYLLGACVNIPQGDKWSFCHTHEGRGEVCYSEKDNDKKNKDTTQGTIVRPILRP